MPTGKYRGTYQLISGGLNDTPHPDNRAPSQSKTQHNVRVTDEGALERVYGRDLLSAETVQFVAAQSFSGSGLNDCTLAGTPTIADRTYRVKVATAGTPDLIDISHDGGTTWARTGVSMAASVTLAADDTVTAAFAATTGHTVDNYWQRATELDDKYFDDGSNSKITGLFTPPAPIPLFEVVSGVNDKISIRHNGTETLLTMTAGKYYDYSTIASTLQTLIQTLTSENDFTVQYNTTTDKFVFTDVQGHTCTFRFPKGIYNTPTSWTDPGSGLNDDQVGGVPTTTGQTWIAEVTATGTPDTFKWSNDGGSNYTTGVSCATTPTYLDDGVYIHFNASTGHAVGDKWTWTTAETTADWCEKLGFKDTITGTSATSQFAVDNEPPYRKVVTTDGKWYWVNTAGTKEAIALPSGDDPKFSPYKTAGYWHNNRLMMSNGVKTYIIRDKYAREATPNNVVQLGSDVAKTGAASVNAHSQVGDRNVSVAIGPHRRRVRLGFKDISTNNIAVDYQRMCMSRSDGTGQFYIDVYFEEPSLGIREWVARIAPDDIRTTAADLVIRPRFVVGVGATTDACLMLEYHGQSTASPLVYIYGGQVATGDGNVTVQDQDGAWSTYTYDSGGTNYELSWFGESMALGITSERPFSRLRFSLTNKDGYETQLGDSYLFRMAQDLTSSLTVGGSVSLAGSALDTWASGNYAVVARGTNGIGFMDISTLGTPAAASVTYHAGVTQAANALGVWTDGTNVFVADGANGCKCFNYSSLADITNDGSFTTASYIDQYNDIVVDTNVCYIANNRQGLTILTYTPGAPGSFAHTATLNFTGKALRLDKSGNYVYVAAGDYGLKIINVATPASPVMTGKHLLGENGHAFDVAVSGNYAYVADGHKGLRILDISTPSSPELIATFKVPSKAISVDVNGTTVYVGDEEKGMIIVDCSVPEEPKSIQSPFKTGGIPKGLFHFSSSSQSWMLIADGAGGFRTVFVENAESPSDDNLDGKAYYTVNVSIPDQDIDYEYINLYRTKSTDEELTEGAAYFLWAKIHRKQVESVTADSFNLYLAVSDDELEKGKEGDIERTRDATLVYRRASWFMGRPFVSGLPDQPHLVYWGDPEHPESFNLAEWYVAAGTSRSPVTAHAPCGERLNTYKAHEIGYIYPVAVNAFGYQSNLDDGIGVQCQGAVIADYSPSGPVNYIQGTDGHFYLTNGLKNVPLSKGRLNTLVGTLNVSAIDETAGFFDQKNQCAVWSICTGSNTEPNKNVIYHAPSKDFFTEDSPGMAWAADLITTDGSLRYVGAINRDLFFWRESDSNLRADIAATWESADWDCNMPEIRKSFISAEISGIAKVATTLTVEVYLDESATASETRTITLGTTAGKHRIKYLGRGTKIRFKITQTGVGGWWRINHMLVEYQQVYRAVR